VSPEQVALAHELGFSMVEQGDALSYLTERPEQFDLIIAFDLLEHLTRTELLCILDGVHKALRPHGRFVVRTPNMNSPFSGRYRYGDFTHEIGFTPRSIKQALKVAGFASVTAREVVIPGDNAARIIRRAAWKCIRLGMLAYLAVEIGEYKDQVLSLNFTAVADK